MAEEDPIRPGHWARFRNWLGHLHFRLVTIEDTPHSIALGVAIGIFFGFTPLWSLKTLLSIAVAWLCKSNKIAAAISVQLHDLILPFMPAIYLWEYKIGYWSLYGHLPGPLQPPDSVPARIHSMGDVFHCRPSTLDRVAHHGFALSNDRLFHLPRAGDEPSRRAGGRGIGLKF